MLQHFKIRKMHLFSVPFHHHIMDVTGIQTENRGYIGIYKNLLTVNFQKTVSDPQSFFPIQRAALIKGRNFRCDKGLIGGKDNTHQ